MQIRDDLPTLADDELLQQFGCVVRGDTEHTAILLRHIAEIDRRKLWAKCGYSSVFQFCIRRHHMSESMAGKRIGVARIAARFPVVFDMVARGELHLSGILLLRTILSEDNHREVLEQARHLTCRETEQLAARLEPKPDVPSTLRKLPKRSPAPALAATASQRSSAANAHPTSPAAPSANAASGSLDCGMVSSSSLAARPVTPRSPDPEPLAPRRYRLQVTIGEEARQNLDRLQGLLGREIPDRDPAAIVERALEVLLAQALKKKAALTDRPRQSTRKSTKRTRHIPAAVRRDVWERDGGQCTFVGEDGHRCTETRDLHFGHREPYARGGAHTIDNVLLRCPPHNDLDAVRDYGAAFMAEKRGRTRGAREELAVYGPAQRSTPTARVPSAASQECAHAAPVFVRRPTPVRSETSPDAPPLRTALRPGRSSLRGRPHGIPPCGACRRGAA